MLLDKTLEELDGVDWGEPTYPGSLIINCHRLRSVPLKDFTHKDLGRLIRQKFSLDWIVPVALTRLLDEPFAGELYEGELISAVLSLPAGFWIGHPDLARSLDLVVKTALAQLPGYVQEYGDLETATTNLLQNYKHNQTTTH